MEAHEDFRPPIQRRGPSLRVVIFFAILFGVVSGFAGTVLALWANQHGRLAFLGASTAAAVPVGATRYVGGGSPGTFAQVADELDESVVNINTMARQQNPSAMFFGGGPQVVRGLGTGVIVSADGYILTNYHVVGEADNITVTVMHKGGKRQYKAELIGGDKQEDLAVVKIKATGLHPVRFGDSDALRPGEWVMAIGNPFGFEHTVSVGVVSALNRSLPVDDSVTLRNMIQTDASINPGNSGGPLVNLQGEVIGINSAVFVGQGNGEPQASGIGFSIPSTHAKKIMDILRDRGTVPHPYIGISYREVTDEMRSTLHLPVKSGVLVMQVLPTGPAAKAGLTRGDVIVSADGKAIRDQAMLGDYINTRDVGQKVALEIRRWSDGDNAWTTKTLSVKVGNKPADFAQRMTPQQSAPQQANPAPVPLPWGF